MVVLVTPGFPATETDDTCIPPLQLLVKNLAQKGIPLAVIALEYPFQSDVYTWHGVQVFPCNGQNRLYLRWRTRWRARAAFRTLARTHTITGVHSFWLGLAWSIGKTLAGSRLPHATTLMGQDVLHRVNGRWLRQLNNRPAGHFVALSAFHAAEFTRETGLTARTVIPWGTEDALSTAAENPKRPIDILGVGSFLPVKNWAQWLQVVQLVQSERPEVRAVLVGDGPEKERLYQICHELDLGKNVEFTGTIPRSAVLELMRQTKVYVHTAHFESFGFVFAEALANGCAVVSTPVGIAPELGTTEKNNDALKTLIINKLNEPFAPTQDKRLVISGTTAAYLKLWHDIGSISSSV